MLFGQHVSLREPRDADVRVLGALRNDIEVQRLLLSRVRPSGDDRVREWTMRVSSQEDSVFFVIANGTGEAIGFVQLTAIDTISGHAKLGIALVEALRGQGAGSEAIRLLATYAVDVLGIRKIWLEVLTENEQAIASYRRVGFLEVGVLQRHHRYGERWLDVTIMEWLLLP